jgi:hypothetical protein
MAAAARTPAELQALILQLHSQVATLTSEAAPTGPAPAAIVFADTPQPLYVDDLIDYSTKWGSSIYEQGCKTLDKKALTDGFGMTPDQTVVSALTCRATAMGWNAGSKQITTFRQKEDEAWKKIPPKDGDKKSKEMGKHTFHWCEHHMAWCMHFPFECRLGNQRKEEQSPIIGGNSTTYAAAAVSIANPQFQALIASMPGLQGRFNED